LTSNRLSHTVAQRLLSDTNKAMKNQHQTAARMGRALCFFVAIALAGIVQAADTIWVRIHHAADEAALQALSAPHALSDYGAFQWGPVSVAELEAMQQAGLAVTATANPFILTLTPSPMWSGLMPRV